jgi:pteridine reductase
MNRMVLQRELTEPNMATEIIETLVNWTDRLDVLVNNASAFVRTEEETFQASDWQMLFDTNVKAPFLLSLAARPLLKKQQGCIINLTDIHADKPVKEYSVYCQTKAALLMQTKSLAREFAPDIRVNAVAPGAAAWPEHDNSLSEAVKQTIIDRTPLKRLGSPEAIAQAVYALVDNSFITGQELKVDGGRSLVE